jgi:putative membrane protein
MKHLAAPLVLLFPLVTFSAEIPDAKFYRDAAEGGMAEVALAQSKNITLPANPSVAEMETKSKLQVLSGQSFDKSYIKGMIKDHEEDIAEFKKEAASGQDRDARAFASATLPTLEAHLKKIQAIAANAGVNGD